MTKDYEVVPWVRFIKGKKLGTFGGQLVVPEHIQFEPQQSVIIEIIIPAREGKKLNDHAVKELVKRLFLEVANKWEDCWQDDDSPQYEISFGVSKAA